MLGTMHAWHAVERGHEVVHLEREREARGASVRNFGLVWVGGRSAGAELGTALRARELWEEIGAKVPGVGFRANGSLTAVRTAAERAVADDVLGRADAAERGYRWLAPDEVRAYNPALRGDLLGALLCERDAAVEPRVAAPGAAGAPGGDRPLHLRARPRGPRRRPRPGARRPRDGVPLGQRAADHRGVAVRAGQGAGAAAAGAPGAAPDGADRRRWARR